MVDKSAVGITGTEFELDIERGKVREFARAVHAQHPQHLKSEEAVTPPTFLTTMAFWEQDVDASNPWDRVKMDTKRGMHAEQEYIFHGPPPKAGDRLKCQSRIEKIFEKQGRRGGTLTFVVMVTEFRDPTGKLVAEARLTGVETGQAPKE